MESSGWGRFLKHRLEASRWVEFQRAEAIEFAQRLPGRFTIWPSAYLATGVK
jgi:hypothetical protein